MMDELQNVEIIELDADRTIMLEFYRRWPKYVIEWSIRQQAGEGDFPLAQGAVEQVPKQGQDAEAIWDALREQARSQAMQAVATLAPPPEEKEHKGFFSRLFGS